MPVTSIAFMKMIWVQMEGMLVWGVWRWHLFGGPDIFSVLTEMALGRGQGLGEVLEEQVGG